MPVNPKISLPVSPGEWVDDSSCECGATYHDFRAGITFAEAADRLRIAFGGYEEGGGFRSRGPVLYMMRVMKLCLWYIAHADCWCEYHSGELLEPEFYQAMYEHSLDPKYRELARRASEIHANPTP